MQFTALLISALSTLTFAAPAPVPATDNITARTCTPYYAEGGQFYLQKDAGSPSSTQVVSFTVPVPVPGPCSLIARFPPGHPIYTSGDAQINVFSGEGSNAPGSLVGTVTLSSDPHEVKTVTINSFQCFGHLSYRFELATQGAGSVSFPQGYGAGIALTYGC